MKLVTRSSKQNASHVLSCGSLARTSVGVACGRLMEVRVLCQFVAVALACSVTRK